MTKDTRVSREKHGLLLRALHSILFVVFGRKFYSLQETVSRVILFLVFLSPLLDCFFSLWLSNHNFFLFLLLFRTKEGESDREGGVNRYQLKRQEHEHEQEHGHSWHFASTVSLDFSRVLCVRSAFAREKHPLKLEDQRDIKVWHRQRQT